MRRIKADDRLDLFLDPFRLGRRQIDLVQYRNDLKVVLDRKVSIASVCASTPCDASTTSSAPSHADSDRETSYEKSTCPGVSIRLRM